MNKKTLISHSFPIAAIGASAGGLEAFTLLLSHLPEDSGIAYVFIPHLDPKHESMMADIISRKTSIPVSEAQEGVRVEQNHIYVIPPDKNISLVDGAVKLSPRASFAVQYMPI